jgi:hypothetical protein
VDGLFWLIPPKLDTLNVREWHIRTAESGAAAVLRNGINRVVSISSVGAGSSPNLGAVTFLEEVDGIFNGAAENVVTLGPGFFMETILLKHTESGRMQPSFFLSLFRPLLRIKCRARFEMARNMLFRSSAQMTSTMLQLIIFSIRGGLGVGHVI